MTTTDAKKLPVYCPPSARTYVSVTTLDGEERAGRWKLCLEYMGVDGDPEYQTPVQGFVNLLNNDFVPLSSVIHAQRPPES
jgi:hypothetical protein